MNSLRHLCPFGPFGTISPALTSRMPEATTSVSIHSSKTNALTARNVGMRDQRETAP